MSETYQFINVPVGTHLQSFGDVVHKLVGSAPWSEGDKVAAQQVITDEFGHPTPIKEFAIAAATAVQQNNELKAQLKAQEEKFNARIAALEAAFAARGVVAQGAPVGSGAAVVVPEVAATTSETAAETAAGSYAEWKAKQEAEAKAGTQV